MKKQGTYLYLIIILLLGLLLAGFIRPLLEGFKEGAGECAPGFKLEDDMCVSPVNLPDPPSTVSIDNFKCKKKGGQIKCGYKLV